MAVAKFILCLVLVVASVEVILGKGGHGGHGGHSHGHSSHGGHGGGSHGSSHSSHSSHSSGSHGSSKSSSGHTYPASSGYSGHGSGGSHGHSYPSSGGYSGHGSGHGYWRSRQASIPTYYTRPQYVYVTQYRNSDSRYSDILHGLTMYNLGRSHSHHDYYYRDHYYTSSRDRVTDRPYGNGIDETAAVTDDAKCYLKLIRDGKQEELNIPCAIVSTFADGNRTSNAVPHRVVDCATLEYENIIDQYGNIQRHVVLGSGLTNDDVAPCLDKTIDNPMDNRGPKIDASNMKCEVEIRTMYERITNDMDCDVLLKYAKMPVPKENPNIIMPERQKLKSMLNNPPWWLSLFVAA